MSRQGSRRTPHFPGTQGGIGSQFTPGFPGTQGGNGGQLTPGFPGSQGGNGGQLTPYFPGTQGGTGSQSHWAVSRPGPPPVRPSDPFDHTRSGGGQSGLGPGPTPLRQPSYPNQGSYLNHTSYQNHPGSAVSLMGGGSSYSDDEEKKKKKKGIPGWRLPGGKPASWRCDSSGAGLVRRKGEKKWHNWGFQIPDRALANPFWNDAERDPPPLGALKPKKRKDED